MKIVSVVIGMSFLCILVGVSCANTVQEQETVMKNEQPVTIETNLFQEGYDIFATREARKPIAQHSYLLAKSEEAAIKIRNTMELSQIVREITSTEDALALVRLIASQQLRPFLQDVYYAEVHQKANQDDLWFAIEKSQYEHWQLHAPSITEEEGVYTIDRVVACYPRLIHGKILTEAKLVNIREWVAPDGSYVAEIRSIIAEGEDIQKILLITK